MAVASAPARRGPDILTLQSIPLSAVTDQPLPTPGAPPVSASRHPDDQAAGVAKEITAEELAAAETAKRGANPAEIAATEAPKKVGAEVKLEPPAAEDDDGIVVPEGLPGYAAREISKIRKQARDRVAAALKTAQGDASDADWMKVFEAKRDGVVAKANQEAALAAKTAKEAQDIAAAAQKELDELRAKVVVEPKPEVTDPKPARSDFDDPDTYDDALVQWGQREFGRKVDADRKAELEADAATKKVAAEAEAAQKVEDDRKSHEAQVLQVQQAWEVARTKAIEKYEDYAEVAEALPENGGPTITEAMASAILLSENGTDIAYHLGQNPEESVRIAQMPNPARQLIEIGRIAERLARPPAPARRARPVEILNDAPNSADTTDAEPDMETYAARRAAAMNGTRRPFFPPGGVH